MTSSVKVSAHCDTDKEVVVTWLGASINSTDKLQDGETKEYYVYDDIEVTVLEVLKETNETKS